MNRKKYTSLIFLTFVMPGLCLAAENEDMRPEATLDEVVVTATRTESSTIGGSSVTVISAEEIESKQQHTVEEVLKSIPGLDVVATGGMGTSTSVFLRGADSKNTLILVDGIMFNDPSDSSRSANIANLTTDNIERIEVVRGPMSVLYGSNATAGVVNIITKKGQDKPTSTIGAEAGSYDTWKVFGSSTGSIDKFNYSFNLSRLETNGFSTANDDNDGIPHAGNTSEKDGWENTTVSGKFSYDVHDNFELAATLRYIDSNIDLDDSGNGYTGDLLIYDPISWTYLADPSGSKEQHNETEQYIGRFDVKNKLFNDLLDSNLYVQASRHDRVGYDNDGNDWYDYLGETQEIGWQGTFKLTDSNSLTVGGALFSEEMTSDSETISEKDADTSSFWGQEQIILADNLEIVAGLRYDDHDQFGSKVTYRIAPSYSTDFGMLLKASYGTGFRAPSLYELYSSYGNENLDAEKSKGWDVGFEQDIYKGNVTIGLTYFEQTFEDRIDYDFITWAYAQQQGDTKTSGVETFVTWQPLDNLTLSANYTYTDTEDPDGKRLARRPLNKVSASARYSLGKALFNLDCRWVGKRDASPYAFDKDGNAVETLDSYTLVNLALSYEMTEQIQIFGRIDNVFDEEYEEVWSYATPGLSGYAGMKYTF